MRQKSLYNFFRSHISTWDEVCIDESKRLRNNVILFSFLLFALNITLLFVMSFFVPLETLTSPMEIAFEAPIIIAFFIQLFRKNYSIVIPLLMGILFMLSIIAGIASGNPDELSIYLVPMVSVIAFPTAWALGYNAALLVVLYVMLHTPVYDMFEAEYSMAFRNSLPVNILLFMLCTAAMEYTRKRTQKNLQTVTDQLRNSVLTDPLTGVFNRRALTAHFGESTENAYGLSFAMMDLDYFKKVNDTFGHEAGDKVLCHLAALVKRSVPPNATFYRWGGEEFLLVLKTRDAALMKDELCKIRTLVAETPLYFKHEDDEATVINVTVSIGGVSAAPDDDIKSCIKAADERMYRAKKSGRDRVVADS